MADSKLYHPVCWIFKDVRHKPVEHWEGKGLNLSGTCKICNKWKGAKVIFKSGDL